MFFIWIVILGVDGEIDSKYCCCCGMLLNIFLKCWIEVVCICVDCENCMEDILYGMEFCLFFFLNGILKNRIIC